MKLTLDLDAGELIDLTETLTEAQGVLSDGVKCLELAQVRVHYDGLLERKRSLRTIEKVIKQLMSGAGEGRQATKT